ncbi:MAG: hypothetical protein OMM_07369 [Candidatus Magnetoglobus multicellularis str. Araruama]|uniref:Uncharacterized protein n=1 Tax=Candidatus Magnetoglobus multicellularis str. Araruama TaxID=890399 RepID=A0A1V1PD58_9BACT|nr:MAG: hypothetical protein OMM_07369 [Candidatus Magnetoglobus multicellularis str. Araruama]
MKTKRFNIIITMIAISFVLSGTVHCENNWKQYYSKDNSYAVPYPDNWGIQTLIQQNNARANIIVEKTGFLYEQKVLISIDVWHNLSNMDLYTWINQYQNGIETKKTKK